MPYDPQKTHRLNLGGDYIMPLRQNALNEWLKQQEGLLSYTLTPLAGDASFRRYFRLKTADKRYVVMDAPPAKEGLASFIQVENILNNQGIHTPHIIATDICQGFALLEDLGDTLLSTELCLDNQNIRYTAALDTLLKIQQCPVNNPALARFNSAHMKQEMGLFKTWFLEHLLDLSLSAREEKQLAQVFEQLATHLNRQPQRFIHRDYHSRNLMIVTQDPIEIGVIDFQDAMEGPFTYDLVSLIKDCYIHWPEETRNVWVSYFYHNLPDKEGWSLDEFQQGLNWCGLQRHLKVLGIFSRLHLRDNKSAYLKDLPLTLQHVMSCMTQYDAFHPLQDLMEKRVLPIFKEKQPA